MASEPEAATPTAADRPRPDGGDIRKMTAAEIQPVARALGITTKTAGTHIERIYAKIGASSRSTATLFALQQGLLDPFGPPDP